MDLDSIAGPTRQLFKFGIQKMTYQLTWSSVAMPSSTLLSSACPMNLAVWHDIPFAGVLSRGNRMVSLGVFVSLMDSRHTQHAAPP
jgi:hypothetical protein